MWLKLDLDGMIFKISIREYESNQDLDGSWTKVIYNFQFQDIISYKSKTEGDEILLSCEIDNLISDLDDLLTGKIEEKKEITFIEPDWNIILENDDYNMLILSVYLWQLGTLTENHFSITFDRKQVEMLYNYLLVVTNRLSLKDTKVNEMIVNGILYEDIKKDKLLMKI